jgi:hypothetical protein
MYAAANDRKEGRPGVARRNVRFNVLFNVLAWRSDRGFDGRRHW